MSEMRYDATLATREVMRDAANPTVGGLQRVETSRVDQHVCSISVGRHRKNVESCCGKWLGRMSDNEMLNFWRGTQDLETTETLEHDACNNVAELSRS